MKRLEMSRRLPGDMMLLGWAWLLLIPMELWAAKAAFENVGEITSGLYFLVVIVGNVTIAFTVPRSRKFALAMVLLLGSAVIPYQIMLAQRHALVQQETARIVAYAHQTRNATGAYPSSLGEYVFDRSETSEYISYALRDEDVGFIVSYHVGTKSTSHWYTPTGGWQYYPD